jgi:streptomycin 6-kinase
MARDYLQRWELRLAGPARHGMVALVLPVVTADGTLAALKLQPLDDFHTGEAAALRTWSGDGAVRLLREDPQTWTLLLERLDSDRDLMAMTDDLVATEVIAHLLRRLNAYAAPPGVPRLDQVAAAMLAQVPQASKSIVDQGLAAQLHRWATIVSAVVGEAGDRLIHWDLHFENVLAGDREPWLAIDPKPLMGNSGFELLPALFNRWEDAVATGSARRAALRRFDLMVEVLELDRGVAAAWTFARLLQNALWDIEDGRDLDPVQLAIAQALEDRL